MLPENATPEQRTSEFMERHFGEDEHLSGDVWPAVHGLYAEVARLRNWVADLQSGMYVSCVYCGHRYGPGETTPASMADALKAHVEQCPQHPMSALRRLNEGLAERVAAQSELLARAAQRSTDHA